MLAEIGLLVSVYVFVRMVDMVLTHSHRPTREKSWVMVLAVLTCLLSVLVGFDMLYRLLMGSTTP